jgi:hypothetical protein
MSIGEFPLHQTIIEKAWRRKTGRRAHRNTNGILLLLAIQAAGQAVTTFYPLPSKQQEQAVLRKAQGLAAGTPVAVAPAAPPVAKPAPKSAEPEKIEVVSVKTVPADANVRFVPEGEKPK